MKRLMMVAFCGVLAAAVAGCKYGKSGAPDSGDAGADTATIAGLDGDGGATGIDTSMENVGGADVTSLDSATVSTRPFDEYLKPVEGAAFEPVYFGFDASSFAQSEIAKIEAVANDLQANAGHVVIIEGNCDERGSNEYNLTLGELRAIAVRDYLVRLGIAADRVQTKSYGEEKPAVQGNNEAAWAKNRRGEFALFQR